ncbi:hypothetical protein F2Q70_00023290 [Brassica cretica]|uniref:Uncharacterized protein n=1 Tax=Brassica cretica TaxID=69181 RepID=A0A8S9GWW1_BRACR|nr:hypothetical protein F2Q70_00023290 [Brassica cretica]
MTRRRHKVNDYVNRLKEILGTVPPACCMELPYFHGCCSWRYNRFNGGYLTGCYRCIWLAWFWDYGVASRSGFSFD